MSKIEIIDNLLPIQYVNEIENKFRFDTTWRLVDYTSGIDIPLLNLENSLEGPQFVNFSYHFEDVSMTETDNDTFYVLKPILFFLCKHFDFEISSLLRIKNNCNLKNISYKNKFHPPHIDAIDDNAFTCAYYINDSDGPLRIFSESGKIIKSIEPKKGRCVVFKSNQYHSGTCPVEHDYRLMSNIIFKTTKDIL